jgi:glutaminyl-tRNA synthetase
MNPNSLQIVKGFVEPSLVWQSERNLLSRLGYFNVDKDSTEIQLSLIKTVIERCWEEKGKRKKIY